MIETKYCLSLGAGINSTAMLIYLVNNKKPLDYVVFADTGGERRETYDYLPRLEQYCKDHNIGFVTVKGTRAGGLSLYDYCMKYKIIPSRHPRFCTAYFKVDPIRRFYKTLKADIVEYLGIAYDELHRMRESDEDYIKCVYPLVDARITRAGCVEIIKKEGWPVPVKSGCEFCFFNSQKAWNDLLLNNPKGYDKAIALEENQPEFGKYKNTFLRSDKKPLRKAKELLLGNQKISLFIESNSDTCDQGYCMT